MVFPQSQPRVQTWVLGWEPVFTETPVDMDKGWLGLEMYCFRIGAQDWLPINAPHYIQINVVVAGFGFPYVQKLAILKRAWKFNLSTRENRETIISTCL